MQFTTSLIKVSLPLPFVILILVSCSGFFFPPFFFFLTTDAVRLLLMLIIRDPFFWSGIGLSVSLMNFIDSLISETLSSLPRVALMIIFLMRSVCSIVKTSLSKESFLKIISFFVRVPVLSDNKYRIRPNSSGITRFRAMVPFI